MRPATLDLICIIGPPGSGKTTLAENLSQQLSAPVVRPRDVIHRAVMRYPELIGMFKKVNNLGWVADDALGFAVRQEVEHLSGATILENLPWDAIQLADLYRVTRKLGSLTLLYLNANDDLVWQRRAGRLDCPKCYPKAVITQDEQHCARCRSLLTARADDEVALFRARLDRHRECAKTILGLAHRFKTRVITLEAAQPPQPLAQQALRLMAA